MPHQPLWHCTACCVCTLCASRPRGLDKGCWAQSCTMAPRTQPAPWHAGTGTPRGCFQLQRRLHHHFQNVQVTAGAVPCSLPQCRSSAKCRHLFSWTPLRGVLWLNVRQLQTMQNGEKNGDGKALQRTLRPALIPKAGSIFPSSFLARRNRKEQRNQTVWNWGRQSVTVKALCSGIGLNTLIHKQ